jgi:hypothetical protein
LYAAILHQLGSDHANPGWWHAGRDDRLTAVDGMVVEEILQS